MSATKRPRYVDIDGQKYSLCFAPEILRATTTYKPSSSDIFVATYPKCGTTWMIQIVMLILRKGNIPADFGEYFASTPFLDMLGPQAIPKMPGPGCLKTHLPFNLTPFSPDAKYIYVARHPRDCMISFYNHTKFFPGYYFTEGTFDDFFEIFITGEVDFGDYFDHLLSWYEHRHEPNILFVTYEEMRADPCGIILKIAKFLGEEQYLHPLEEDEKLMADVMTKSSLEYMRDTTNAVWGEIVIHPQQIMNNPNMLEGLRLWAKVNAEALDAGEKSVGQFIGSSGHKIQLSAEQQRRLNERILEMTKSSDVMNLWKATK